MRLKQQAVSGMLWTGGSRLTTQAIDQVFTIILVRLLAPGDFGLMAMAAVFTTLFNLFTDMGIAAAVVQRPELDEEYLSSAFWGNLCSGLALCGLTAGASVLIARFYGQPSVQPVVAALGARFVFAGLNATQSALLTREMRFATLTMRRGVAVIAGGIVGVALASSGAGVWSLVAQALTISFVMTVLLWVSTSWRPRRLFSWQKFAELWAFGSRVLGGRFFHFAVKNVDNLLIGKMLGATLLGYYAFAYGLFLFPMVDIGIIVGRVIFPTFARLQNDAPRLRVGFLMTTRYLAFFAFPAIVGLWLVTPDMVPVVFGVKWLPAVPVLRVLLIAGLLLFHTSLWTAVLQATGRVDWLFRYSIVSACTYVPAFFIGLRWGIVGVATGYTVSTIVMLPALFVLVRRLVRFSMAEYARTLLPVVATSAIMAGVVVLAQAVLAAQNAAPAARLVGAVLIGVVTYAAAALLIQRDLISGLTATLKELRQPRKRERRRREAPQTT